MFSAAFVKKLIQKFIDFFSLKFLSKTVGGVYPYLISASPTVNLSGLSMFQHLHLDSQVSGNARLPSNPAEPLNSHFLGAEIPGFVLVSSDAQKWFWLCLNSAFPAQSSPAWHGLRGIAFKERF